VITKIFYERSCYENNLLTIVGDDIEALCRVCPQYNCYPIGFDKKIIKNIQIYNSFKI